MGMNLAVTDIKHQPRIIRFVDETSAVMGNATPLTGLTRQMRRQNRPVMIRNIMALGDGTA